MKFSLNCDENPRPVPGQIALVKSGRCAGHYVIIIKLADEHSVLVADGGKLKKHPSKEEESPSSPADGPHSSGGL